MSKEFICPFCGEPSTSVKWDEATYDEFADELLDPLEDAVEDNNEDAQYVCPNCSTLVFPTELTERKGPKFTIVDDDVDEEADE
jgi:predicted RNA-binding Zn-ribbon protein involved in translation (DUF1610 family)